MQKLKVATLAIVLASAFTISCAKEDVAELKTNTLENQEIGGIKPLEVNEIEDRLKNTLVGDINLEAFAAYVASSINSHYGDVEHNVYGLSSQIIEFSINGVRNGSITIDEALKLYVGANASVLNLLANSSDRTQILLVDLAYVTDNETGPVVGFRAVTEVIGILTDEDGGGVISPCSFGSDETVSRAAIDLQLAFNKCISKKKFRGATNGQRNKTYYINPNSYSSFYNSPQRLYAQGKGNSAHYSPGMVTEQGMNYFYGRLKTFMPLNNKISGIGTIPTPPPGHVFVPAITNSVYDYSLGAPGHSIELTLQAVPEENIIN